MPRKIPVTVGCHIALNDLPDATWFEVLAIDGFVLTIREAGTNYREQTTDLSLVRQVRAAPVSTLTMLTIKADGTLAESQIAPSDLQAMQAAVGGYVESVPHWDHFDKDGTQRRCWAICNEEGKLNGLPVNLIASALWFKACPQMAGVDVLVGNVALIYGDAALMAEL